MHRQGDGIGIGGTAVVGGSVADTHAVPVHIGSLREGECYRIRYLVILYKDPGGGALREVVLHFGNVRVDLLSEAGSNLSLLDGCDSGKVANLHQHGIGGVAAAGVLNASPDVVLANGGDS